MREILVTKLTAKVEPEAELRAREAQHQAVGLEVMRLMNLGNGSEGGSACSFSFRMHVFTF